MIRTGEAQILDRLDLRVDLMDMNYVESVTASDDRTQTQVRMEDGSQIVIQYHLTRTANSVRATSWQVSRLDASGDVAEEVIQPFKSIKDLDTIYQIASRWARLNPMFRHLASI